MSSPDPGHPGAVSRRRSLSALAVTWLLLIMAAAGVAVWLATAPAPDDGARNGVTVAIASSASTDTGMEARIRPVSPPVATMPEAAASQPPAETAPEQAPAEPQEAPPKAAQSAPASTPAQAPPAEDQTAAAQSLPLPSDGLAKAPDPSLVEPSRFGRLPRIAPDGRKAWQAYARPFDANDQRPRISVIIMNLGLSSAATEAAIQRLPGSVSLSFSPYARGLEQWIALARAAGHEVLLDLPMEPINFPANDPGPDTLLTSLTSEQNRTRMHSLLGRVTGYVGVVNQMGSRFTTSAPHLRPVLTELRDRGLLFVDSRSSLRSVAARTATEIGLPRIINNRFIDAEASRSAIDERLEELQRIARISDHAVGIGQPFPVTIDRLVRWTRAIEEEGFALAPASAMVNTQPD